MNDEQSKPSDEQDDELPIEDGFIVMERDDPQAGLSDLAALSGVPVAQLEQAVKSCAPTGKTPA